VYSDADLAELSSDQNDELHHLYQYMLKKTGGEMVKADYHLIADVDYDDNLGKSFDNLSDEDPRVHQGLQAMTRDIQPTVSLVCLIQVDDGSLFTLDGHLPFQLDQKPEGELIHALQRSVVTVSDRRVVEEVRKKPLFQAWKDIASLRYFFPLILNSEDHGQIGEIECQLDRELGFQVGEQIAEDPQSEPGD